jgi:hypothetical protein
MKRLRQRVYNRLAVLSLVLCGATAALWISSCWRQDTVMLNACHGVFTEPHTIVFWRTATPQFPGGRLYHSGPSSRRQTRPFGLILQHSQGSIFVGFLGFIYRSWLEPAHPPFRLIYVGIPFWFPLVITSLAPTVWILTRKKPSKIGVCIFCGYDLRATPNRCPECGTVPSKPRI